MTGQFDISAYDYELPRKLIAQDAVTPRDSSRLLILNRASGEVTDSRFSELPNILHKDDLLVVNNTRVFPARLLGRRPTGGKSEVMLLKHLGEAYWQALVQPGRKLAGGTIVEIADDFAVEICERMDGASRRVRLIADGDIWQAIEMHGHTPLPQYIARPDCTGDAERYQTIYAKERGAVAAPTAGLHFTEELLEKLKKNGVDITKITLHVSWGTFRGIDTEDIRDHRMHAEDYTISEETADRINRALSDNRRIVAVGTTTVRALESAAIKGLPIESQSANTELFIMPGFEFKITRAMITNFHLPKSSLLVMISAFAEREMVKTAYRHAIDERYRFYSYGDAMLII